MATNKTNNQAVEVTSVEGKRVYILGKGETVFRTSYNPETKKFMKPLQMEAAVKGDVENATRINVLKGLIESVSLINDMDQIVKFYVSDLVADALNNGWYKYWMVSGKTNSGNIISEGELELWLELHNLMAEKVTVIVEGLKGAKRRKTRQGNLIPDVERERNERLIARLWEEVAKFESLKHQEEQEEDVIESEEDSLPEAL